MPDHLAELRARVEEIETEVATNGLSQDVMTRVTQTRRAIHLATEQNPVRTVQRESPKLLARLRSIYAPSTK